MTSHSQLDLADPLGHRARRPGAFSRDEVPADAAVPPASAPSSSQPGPASVRWLDAAITSAARLLPGQSPLETFVHHNTLHAYEHLPFHDALDAARGVTGASGYLTEDAYRDAFRAGRILESDLTAAIERWAPETLPPLPEAVGTRSAFCRLAMVHDVSPETPTGLLWSMTEHRAGERFARDVSPEARARILRSVRGDCEAEPRGRAGEGSREAEAVSSLWRACVARAAAVNRADRRHDAASRPEFPREAALVVTADDANDWTHPVLITLSGAFLDGGQAHWSMPDRTGGFFAAFCRVLGAGHAVRPAWLAGLGARVRGWEARHASAREVVETCVDELGIDPSSRSRFVEHALLQLPGWAGMFHRLESTSGRPDRARARVVDFLAVRLVLDVFALAEIARRLGYHGPLAGLCAHCASMPSLSPEVEPGDHDRAWPLFVLSQHAGIAAPDVLAWPASAVRDVLRALERFDGRARLRVWHEAYERRYRQELLGAIHSRALAPVSQGAPKFQVVFCLDDREESLRRHFEQASDRHVTLGTAGFFNLAIAYRGIDDPSTFPLCPVVVEPAHQIDEEPLAEHAHLAVSRRRWRRRVGLTSAQFGRASRSLVWGAFVTALAGLLAALPMLASVFAPRIAGLLRRRFASWMIPSPATRLALPAETTAPERGDAPERGNPAEPRVLSQGFSLREKVDRVAGLLESIGLTRDFARVVALVGHTSTSANNPHAAAYACGACGGRSGGPNARLFARMANRPEVRAGLRARGIDVPDATVFVGAEHDTCADEVAFFDLDAVPADARGDVDALRAELERACGHNARERCRRFDSAPSDPSCEAALRHVKSRAFDLSQARPELGHATNAACVVGRRALTRALFLDRRVFLSSYDPSCDGDDARVLGGILGAVGPVCSGINLEYLFSSTDPERLGAGTKLPHNVTGLVGVMNGASSDLRTGLPRQMTEAHEPLRLLVVVESPPARLLDVVDRQPGLRRLVRNEWIRLAAVDPHTRAISLFDARRGFEPWEPDGDPVPEAEASRAWYRRFDEIAPPALLARSSRPEVDRAI